MSQVAGNDNLAYAKGSQFLTVDGTSDTLTIPAGVYAVDLYAAAACWVTVGAPGATPTAAAGSEKTTTTSFYLPATLEKTIAIPIGDDTNQVKIAAIQDSAGGNLYVTYREFT